MLYEHQNNVSQLKEEQERALKLQLEEHRLRESESKKDKRSLKLELKELGTRLPPPLLPLTRPPQPSRWRTALTHPGQMHRCACHAVRAPATCLARGRHARAVA